MSPLPANRGGELEAEEMPICVENGVAGADWLPPLKLWLNGEMDRIAGSRAPSYFLMVTARALPEMGGVAPGHWAVAWIHADAAKKFYPPDTDWQTVGESLLCLVEQKYAYEIEIENAGKGGAW